jgi:hypothetical protein
MQLRDYEMIKVGRETQNRKGKAKSMQEDLEMRAVERASPCCRFSHSSMRDIVLVKRCTERENVECGVKGSSVEGVRGPHRDGRRTWMSNKSKEPK